MGSHLLNWTGSWRVVLPGPAAQRGFSVRYVSGMLLSEKFHNFFPCTSLLDSESNEQSSTVRQDYLTFWMYLICLMSTVTLQDSCILITSSKEKENNLFKKSHTKKLYLKILCVPYPPTHVIFHFVVAKSSSSCLSYQSILIDVGPLNLFCFVSCQDHGSSQNIQIFLQCEKSRNTHTHRYNPT